MTNPDEATVTCEQSWTLALSQRRLSDHDYVQEVHYDQQIEVGRPTRLPQRHCSACEVFEMSLAKLVRGLDEGIYEKLDVEPRVAKKRRS